MIARYKRELAVALAFAVLLGLLAVWAPLFYTSDEPVTILVSSAPLLVLGVGMTLVILARQIDISIGSQLSVCGIVAGLLVKAGVPVPAAFLASVLLGALMGAVNGALVAGLGLPSIVVTLATMLSLREGLRWLQQGETVNDLPAGFQWFGVGQATGEWIIVGVAAVVFVVFALALRELAAGRAVYAVGSDAEAARLAGIRPGRVVFTTFVLMGALTGLAAMLGAVRFGSVDPNAGLGRELDVIAAVVVGGTAISGGRGTLLGTLLGVLLLRTMQSALPFLGAPAHWIKALQGVIILAAFATGAVRLKRRSNVRASLATH